MVCKCAACGGNEYDYGAGIQSGRIGVAVANRGETIGRNLRQ
jgi:hypothetical protein